MKTALVIGATGLVGSHLTRFLLGNEDYGRVRVFVRRPTGLRAGKLEEHVVDFERVADWAERLAGDELFSALGTTRKQAGSKAVQYRVDFTYQHEVAAAAARHGIESYLLVSSAGADPRSRMFYPRIKGELEEAVKALPFRRIGIFQPAVLLGEREERRPGEALGARFARLAARLVPPLRKYRPIEGEVVARAMVAAACDGGWSGVRKYVLDQIFEACVVES